MAEPIILKDGSLITKSIKIPGPVRDVSSTTTVTFTLPAGIVIASTTLSNGSFAAGVWTLSELVKGQEEILGVVFQITDNAEAPFKINVAVVNAEDVTIGNNEIIIAIDGITCTEMYDCVLPFLPQSDWDVNEITDPSFIKNKPVISGDLMTKTVYDPNDDGKVVRADNADTVGLAYHTVETSVPPGAVFTDTTYSDAEIKTKYESNADTNEFTDAEKTKLGTVETGAKDDQTGAEIKALYEAEANTNAFTDADETKVGHISVTQPVDLDAIETKLATIETDAKDDQAASEVPITPSGNLTSTNVQAALEELQNDIDTGGVGDNLGNHTATEDLKMATFNITGVGNVDGRDVSADGTKLDTIETNAKDDQTGAEIKALYEAEADTNAFTDAEKTKLGTVETAAKDDQDASEVPYTGTAPSNYTAATPDVEAHLEGIDTAIGGVTSDVSTVTPQGDGSFRHNAGAVNTDIAFELGLDGPNIQIKNSDNGNVVNAIDLYCLPVTNQSSSTSTINTGTLYLENGTFSRFELRFSQSPTPYPNRYNTSDYYFSCGSCLTPTSVLVTNISNVLITSFNGNPQDWDESNQFVEIWFTEISTFGAYSFDVEFSCNGTTFHTVSVSGVTSNANQP